MRNNSSIINYNDVFEFTNLEVYNKSWDGDGHIVKKIYGVLRSKFNIGDIVKVINHGSYYSTYKAMVLAMGFKKSHLRTEDFDNGAIGTVIGVKLHETNGRVLYGVKLHDEWDDIVIIEERGLKLVKRGDVFQELEDKDFMI